MSKEDFNFALVIGQIAFITGKAIEQHFEKQNIDLNSSQYTLMGFLYQGHELIQQDLAKILKKDKSSVLRSIDLLQKRNLVIRIPHPVDRRKKKLQLTESGNTLFKQANTIVKQVLDQMLAGLSQEEISAFRKVAAHLQSKSVE